jgi:cell division initiation protein
MKVTPLDLRQQKFQTVMRGYDRGEVNAFLAEAADDYENALRENDRLRQELSKTEAVLNEHRGQEKNLRNTLLTAQKLADEIRDNAEKEASRILRDAEGRADLLLQKSQSRVEEVQREIDGLRLKRKDVETSLESIISALYNTIEFVREQDTKHKEEKVLLHRPRNSESQLAAVVPSAPSSGPIAVEIPEPLAALEEALARTAQ